MEDEDPEHESRPDDEMENIHAEVRELVVRPREDINGEGGERLKYTRMMYVRRE